MSTKQAVPADGNTTAMAGEFIFESAIKKSTDALGNGVGGYIVETRMAWSTFGIDPVIGKQLLFIVETHDYDPYFEDGVWKDNAGLVNVSDIAAY